MRRLSLLILISLIIISCGSCSNKYKKLLQTDNAPFLGPVFRDFLIAYCEADGDGVLSMLSQEDLDWHIAYYNQSKKEKSKGRGDDPYYAQHSSSYEEFFQKCLAREQSLRTLNGMISVEKTTRYSLAGLRLLDEKALSDKGELHYKVFQKENIHTIGFKQESGKWKICGIRILSKFEATLQE